MTNWSNWQVIYEDNWSSEFRNIVRRRMPYSADQVEDTMREVRQELAIKLGELAKAPHAVNAYIRTAFRHTLEDYLRKKEGYPRAPQWIKRLGGAYERIYKLLCLENRAVNDIHATLASLYQYSRDFIEHVITEVRAGVVNCGRWRDTVCAEQAQAEVDAATQQGRHATPQAILQDMDVDSVIAVILGNKPKQIRSSNMAGILQQLGQCPLDDNARLLLRLVYADGLSISHAAREINMADSKARKLLKQTLEMLRKVLSLAGITEL